MGVFYAAGEFINDEATMKKHGLTPGFKGKRIIVQGFGKVGYNAAKYIVAAGAKLVGVVEHDGSLYNSNGIDPEKLYRYRTHKQTISTYPIGDTYQNDEVLYKECDFLVTAALDNVITKDNANKINAKVVIEASNGPTTQIAEEILEKRNILVLPDVLLSGGGLAVSYFEWLKNLDHMRPGQLSKRWEEKSKLKLINIIEESTKAKFDIDGKHSALLAGPREEDIVHTALEDVMSSAAKEVKKVAEEKKISLRLASFVYAIERIDLAYREAGITI